MHSGATRREYFSVESLRLLAGLTKNNNREWFEARRPAFELHLRQPMLALIDDVSAALHAFAPEHTAPAAKIMLRIHRDTRFSPDKRPYKTHLAAWWGLAGVPRTSGAGFYFHLSEKGCEVAAGLFMPTPDQLLAVRTDLLTAFPRLRQELARLTRAGFLPSAAEDALTRAPRGFPSGHEAIDLVKQKRWGAEKQYLAIWATQPAPGLDERIAADFSLAAALVHLLNRPIAPSRSSTRPLF